LRKNHYLTNSGRNSNNIEKKKLQYTSANQRIVKNYLISALVPHEMLIKWINQSRQMGRGPPDAYTNMICWPSADGQQIKINIY